MNKKLTPRSSRSFSIGLENPQNSLNVGGVIRAAQAFDCGLVIIEQSRSNSMRLKSQTDTGKGYKSIPVIFGDIAKSTPYAHKRVAVELVEDAVSLVDFTHPRNALYIFGPENGSISEDLLAECEYKIFIPSRICLNLAACVNVVLYDRVSKIIRNTNRIPFI